MTEIKLAVDAVRVEGRHRKDLGDIAALAASIERDGLLHAIAVTPDYRLLAGERRLAAVRSLGRTEIDARIIDTFDDAVAHLRMERDENVERKAMTPSELVALGRTLEVLERAKAVARRTQAAGAPRGEKVSSVQPTGRDESAGRETRDVVGAALGISGTTYMRAKKVVEAADDRTLPTEDQKIAREALADMDATGKVSGAYERVVNREQARTGAPKITTIGSAVAQRRALSTAETALSGICYGLRQITSLHPDITKEEAAQWVDGLSESRRVLEALIKRLKERTNAQA